MAFHLSKMKYESWKVYLDSFEWGKKGLMTCLLGSFGKYENDAFIPQYTDTLPSSLSQQLYNVLVQQNSIRRNFMPFLFV